MANIRSVGGKEFRVTRNGGDVHVEWFDVPMSEGADALFDADNAAALIVALTTTYADAMVWRNKHGDECTSP
jgi:hypothetical protein